MGRKWSGPTAEHQLPMLPPGVHLDSWKGVASGCSPSKASQEAKGKEKTCILPFIFLGLLPFQWSALFTLPPQRG
uniref:Uncharacterized protein n=1 Tax=Gorilla gorilla gorilla TaxID=9595 RepID=A0A2I2YWA6_GORGO